MITLGLSRLRGNGTSTTKLTPPPRRLPVTPAAREAAAWCSSATSQAACWRIPALDPSSILAIPSWLSSTPWEKWHALRELSFYEAVEYINRTRSSILRDAASDVGESGFVQTGGRLLLYEAFESVNCGASQASSDGFFDIEDAPAWDTWFHYENGTISCWIPNSAVARVQAGIDANPVDCIHWASWSESRGDTCQF